MKYKCTKCSVKKNRNDFYKDAQKRTGYRPDCKKCNNKSSIDWAKQNIEQRKFNVLKSATGVNKEQYLKLLSLQNEKCAICNMSVEENNKKLSIDHCHTTMLVRGLLCTRCNFGIGYFKDNKVLLEKAILYLNNNFSYLEVNYIEPKNKRNNERNKKKSENAR